MSTEEEDFEFDTSDMISKSINLGLWLLGFVLTVLIVHVLYDDTLVKYTSIFKKSDGLWSIVKLVTVIYCLMNVPVVRLRFKQ